MEAVYYMSLVLLALSFLVLPLLLIVLLIKPHLLNNRSFISNPFSRGKIIAVTFLIFFVSFVGFGGVMAATEPEYVKKERAARELAEQKAKQEAEFQAKKRADEEEKRRQEEARKPVTKTETKAEPIAFKTITKNDAALPKGQKKTVTEGVEGERTITYDVTYQEGKEVRREEIMREVTTKPTNRLVKVGTYVAPMANPTPAAPATPKPQYKPKPVPRSAYYKNCSAARAAGAAPVYRGQPGYARHLDRDDDGVGCE